MNHWIKKFPNKQLIGKRLIMSFADNKTGQLWASFIPHCKTIRHTVGTNLYSLQTYSPGFFKNFNPATPFEKWAAVEVSATDEIPKGMEVFNLTGGLYAVFPYIGHPAESAPFFQEIFKSWLPKSEYDLDDRPHFEVLGEKYKNNDPSSEEEIWIPVKPKN